MLRTVVVGPPALAVSTSTCQGMPGWPGSTPTIGAAVSTLAMSRVPSGLTAKATDCRSEVIGKVATVRGGPSRGTSRRTAPSPSTK